MLSLLAVSLAILVAILFYFVVLLLKDVDRLESDNRRLTRLLKNYRQKHAARFELNSKRKKKFHD